MRNREVFESPFLAESHAAADTRNVLMSICSSTPLFLYDLKFKFSKKESLRSGLVEFSCAQLEKLEMQSHLTARATKLQDMRRGEDKSYNLSTSHFPF